MAQFTTCIERHGVITLTPKRRAKVEKLILSIKFELNLFAGSRNDLENMHIICIYERVVG